MGLFKDMDDFNGTFCNEGPFPVVSAVSECFKKKPIKTTPIPPTTTEELNLYVPGELDYDNLPKKPVMEILIQGNLLDKNSIFDYDDGDWFMLNGMMNSGVNYVTFSLYLLSVSLIMFGMAFY